MQGEPLFLGIYANSAEADAGNGQKVSRWHAWGLPDGSFLMQKILTDDPQGQLAPPKPIRINEDVFFAEFRVFAAFSSRYHPVFPRDPAEWLDRTKEATKEASREASLEDARADTQADVPDLPVDLDEPELLHRVAPRPGWAGEPELSQRGGTARQNWAGEPELPRRERPQQNWAGEPERPMSQTDYADEFDKFLDGQSVVPEREATARSAGRPEPAGRLERTGGKPGQAGPVSFADVLALSVAEEEAAEAAADPDYVIVKGGAEKKSGYQFRSFSLEADAQSPYGPVEMSAEEAEQIEGRFLADFSMALIKMKDKQNEALRNMQALADNPGPFARDHKFMFTDCGLALRKLNFYALAALFHEKALELAPHDEHVLFNLARVMYESGKVDKARDYLRLSLELNPRFAAGQDFLAFVDGLRVQSM